MRHMTNTQSSSAKTSALLAVLLRSDGTRPDTAGCVPRMVYFTTEQGAVAYAVAAAPPDVFDMLQSKEYLAEDSEGTGKIPMVVSHSFDWFEEFKRLKFCLPGESSGVPDPEAADPEAADPEAADPEGPMSQVEGIVFGQLMKRLTRLGLDTTQPEGCDDLVRDIFGARPIELLERDTGGDQVSVVYSGELKPEEVQNFLKHASKEWRTLFDPRPSLLLRPYFLWPAVAVGFTAGTMALYWAVKMLPHHYNETAPVMNSSILGIGNFSLDNTTANTPLSFPTSGAPTTTFVSDSELVRLKEPLEACFTGHHYDMDRPSAASDICGRNEGAFMCSVNRGRLHCYRYGGATGIDFARLQRQLISNAAECALRTVCDDDYKAPLITRNRLRWLPET